MSTADRTVDVVVAGAGYSGLNVARHLVAAGLDVLVLEARDRVGGRVWTEVTPGGATVDHGGQWLGPTQEHLAALAGELGAPTFPTWVEGANLEVRDGTRHEFTGLVPTSDADASADAIAALLDLDLLALEVSASEPWTHPDALRLDQRTVAAWMEENVESRGARDMIATAVLAVYGAEPSELSLLFALGYAHGGGGMSALIRTAGGAQETRFTGGAQQLALRLAEELGERVVLDAPVVEVAHAPDGVTVVARRTAHGGPTTDGSSHQPWRVRARRLVVAMPPAVQGRIAFDPPLPGAREQLAQHAPMGSVTKIHAVYDRPFWRDEGLSGQLIADTGAVRAIFDDSPDDATHGILVGFIAGREDRRLEHAGPDGRRALALDELAFGFGPLAAEPVEFVEQRWSAEPYSRGGPVACFAPGILTGCGEALRAPVGPIHWAGTETATAWSGYIDGALSSGERAAAEVAAALGAG